MDLSFRNFGEIVLKNGNDPERPKRVFFGPIDTRYEFRFVNGWEFLEWERILAGRANHAAIGSTTHGPLKADRTGITVGEGSRRHDGHT
jgi:hypothetical protein